MSARILLNEGPARGQKRAKHLPPQARRARQFPLRAPLAFRLCSAHLRCVTPSVTLRIFPTHGQRSAERDLPGARGSDDQTNQLNQWRDDAIVGRTHSGRFVSRTSPANRGFSCTSARRALAELHSERARTATRNSIAGRDRQEMGEDAARRLGRIIGLARPNIGAPLEGEGRSAADALIN